MPTEARKKLKKVREALDDLERELPFKVLDFGRETDLLMKLSNLQEDLQFLAVFCNERSNSYKPEDWREALRRVARSLETLAERVNDN